MFAASAYLPPQKTLPKGAIMKKIIIYYAIAMLLIIIGITISYSTSFYPLSYIILITAGIFVGMVIKSI